MPLTPGTRLGAYEVVDAIGAGGMGEVYRAHDTKLDRDVALKVLPEAFTLDPDRLARFEREAKVLASLNHPNIGHIYGLEEAEGVKALVLELVDGPTLADRIEQGPIPLDEALPIATQIAEALEAAHEQGVIHRDLKPANVKVKDDGTVKVLDFGLAKALDTTQEGDPSQSPTLTAMASQAGVIMGTAAYMSPEQARGEAVDRRADIWAFGVVFYEMLTGRRPFEGRTVSDTLASVLAREPDLDTLPTNIPRAVYRLLRRCFEKEPKKRLRDIGEGLMQLEEGLSDEAAPSVAPGPKPPVRRLMPWLAGALVGGVVVGLGTWLFTSPSALPRLTMQFAITPPDSVPLQITPFWQDLAITPDGSKIIYNGILGGQVQLFVRPTTQLAAAPLRGSDGGYAPFVSPGGEWVGFADSVSGALKKISIDGGPPVTICELPGRIVGASWGEDDTIIFGTSGAGLFRVPGAGGEPEALTSLDTDNGEVAHRWPVILPNGRAVVFGVATGRPIDTGQLAVLSLDSGEITPLGLGGIGPAYLPTGHLVYAVDDTLRAVGFDLSALEVRGDPVPVVEGVVTKVTGAADFSVSEDGLLVYVPGAGAVAAQGALVWVDREGRWEQLDAEPLDYSHPRISPDGTRIALSVAEQSGGRDIHVYDLARSTTTRLTVDPAVEDDPLWAPDGQSLVFRSTRDDGGVYRRAADGTGAVEPLTTGSSSAAPFSYSRDGTVLVFGQTDPDTGDDLYVLPLDKGETPALLLQTDFDEEHAALSPDGRWLAYTSDETGSEGIYVRPFPNIDDGKVTISADGGREPLWRPDGQELFYLSQATRSLMVVLVETEPTFRAGTAEPLFELPTTTGIGGVRYDVAPDGQRFLFITPAGADSDDGPTVPQINVVVNWFQELNARVPVP